MGNQNGPTAGDLHLARRRLATVAPEVVVSASGCRRRNHAAELHSVRGICSVTARHAPRPSPFGTVYPATPSVDNVLATAISELCCLAGVRQLHSRSSSTPSPADAW